MTSRLPTEKRPASQLAEATGTTPKVSCITIKTNLETYPKSPNLDLLGFVILYTENPDRQAKTTLENYIHGVVIDPHTLLTNFGQSRFSRASRIEKEAKILVNQWNKAYGPQARNEAGACMPKAVMFQVTTSGVFISRHCIKTIAFYSWPSTPGPRAAT